MYSIKAHVDFVKLFISEIFRLKKDYFGSVSDEFIFICVEFCD